MFRLRPSVRISGVPAIGRFVFGLFLLTPLAGGCGFGDDPDVVIFDNSDDGSSDVEDVEDRDLGETDPGVTEKCSFGAQPVILSRLPDAINEASGMAVSVVHPDVFWMNNDSGDSATIYAVERDSGDEVGRVSFPEVTAIDWEDIAVSGCTAESDDSCIFVADFGDNEMQRESIVFYRLEEPMTLESDAETLGFDAMIATYPDGAVNAEAMVVDDGIVWVFSKRRSGFEVYSHEFEAGATVVLEKAGVVEFADAFEDPAYEIDTVTAADWSEAHRSLVMRTYSRIYVFGWDSGVGATVLDVLGDPSFVLKPGPEFQGESIAWVEDGIAHVAEGPHTPIFLLPCE